MDELDVRKMNPMKLLVMLSLLLVSSACSHEPYVSGGKSEKSRAARDLERREAFVDLSDLELLGASSLDEPLSLIRLGETAATPERSDEIKARIRLRVMEDGTVGEVTILEISDPEHHTPVEGIVLGSQYTPPRLNGKPVRVEFTTEFTFMPSSSKSADPP